MRIALWALVGLLSALLLGALLPWLTIRDLRRSGKGREFLILILTLAGLLGVLLWNLLRR